MRRAFLLSFLVLLIVGVWVTCKRADDEPDYPISPISRLYVSFSDLATDDSGPLENIVVYDPADSTDYFPTTGSSEALNSTPKRGMGIFFSPILSQGFQISHDDTTVKYFSVNDVGTLGTTSRSFKDTVQLHSPRAIEYDRYSDLLFITNDATDTASLNMYYNPGKLSGQQYPKKRLQLDARPWDLASGMKISDDSVMLVSMLGDTKQIWAFKMHNITAGDQLVKGTPDYTLTITGANDLRGIAYSDSLDMLAITDLGEDASGTTVDGKVYLIENASQVIASGGNILPSRIITGAATTLANPVDVAIAGSPDRNQFIYVADRNKRILRFAIDAASDTAPDQSVSTSLTPSFIYLDARSAGK
ncbi:hypothetical protein [Olivibacter ginsenosidimutans]